MNILPGKEVANKKGATTFSTPDDVYQKLQVLGVRLGRAVYQRWSRPGRGGHPLLAVDTQQLSTAWYTGMVYRHGMPVVQRRYTD